MCINKACLSHNRHVLTIYAIVPYAPTLALLHVAELRRTRTSLAYRKGEKGNIYNINVKMMFSTDVRDRRSNITNGRTLDKVSLG